MTRQPDPAIVRALLAKHHDGDQPTACETCVLADALTSEQHATHDYAAETRRLRTEIANLIEPLSRGGMIDARRISARLADILNGDTR